MLSVIFFQFLFILVSKRLISCLLDYVWLYMVLHFTIIEHLMCHCCGVVHHVSGLVLWYTSGNSFHNEAYPWIEWTFF